MHNKSNKPDFFDVSPKRGSLRVLVEAHAGVDMVECWPVGPIDDGRGSTLYRGVVVPHGFNAPIAWCSADADPRRVVTTPLGQRTTERIA